jgi:hypothetical protein
MPIHEHVPPQAQWGLQEVMDEGLELVRVARREGQPRSLRLTAQSAFIAEGSVRAELEEQLTGREVELWETVYVKLKRSWKVILKNAEKGR